MPVETDDFQRGFEAGKRAIIDGGRVRVDELEAKLARLQAFVAEKTYPSQVNKSMEQADLEVYCRARNECMDEVAGLLSDALY